MERISYSIMCRLLEIRKNKKIIYIFIALMGIVISGIVFYVLSLPAATMENDAFCCLEEHIHSGECYESILVCDITYEIYETIGGMPLNPEEIPEDADIGINLICELEECEEHIHDDDCYWEKKIHEHTDECYDLLLICGLEEHTHIDECFIINEENGETKETEEPGADIDDGEEEWGYEAEYGMQEDTNSLNFFSTPIDETGSTEPSETEEFTGNNDDGQQIDPTYEAEDKTEESEPFTEQETGETTEPDTEKPSETEEFTGNNDDGQQIDPTYEAEDKTEENESFTEQEPEEITEPDTEKSSETEESTGNNGDGQEIDPTYEAEDETEDNTEGETETQSETETQPEEPEKAAGNYASMMPMAATTYPELENFLEKLEIFDYNGNPMEQDDEFILGGNYTFSLTFKEKENGGIQFAYNEEGYLTYQLPEELLVPQSLIGEHIIYGNENVEIGRYSIAADGLITVWFKNCNRDGAEQSVNFIEYYQNAWFTLEISTQFKEIFETKEIDFGNNHKITVKIDQSAELDVKKTSEGYNPADDTIEYEIVVTAYGQEIKVTNLIDTPVLDGTDLQGSVSDISIKDATVTVDGTETPITLMRDGTSYKFVFDPAINLKPGESAVIKYTADLSELLKDKAKVAGSLKNTVVITGETTTIEPIPVKGEDDETTDIKREFLRKKGWSHQVPNEDGERIIIWDNVHVLGDGSTNLVGATITDTLGEGLKFKGDVTIWIDGSHVYTFTPDPNSDTFSYVVDPTQFFANTPYTNAPEIYHLQLHYDTLVVDDIGNGKDYFNTIKITWENSDSYELKGGAWVGPTIDAGNADVEKVGKPVIKDGKEYIEFTIECFIPKILYGQFLYLYDHLSVTVMGTQYAVENIPEYVSVKAVKAATGNEWADDEWKWKIFNLGEATTWLPEYQRWYLYFTEDEKIWENFHKTNKATSFSPFNEDTILTITYSIPLTARIVELNSSPYETLGDVLKLNNNSSTNVQSGYLTNQIQLYNDGAVLDQDFAQLTWPIQKTGKLGTSGGEDCFEYSVFIPASMLADSDLPPVFIDTFDPRLEYIPGTFDVWSAKDEHNYYLHNGTWSDNIRSENGVLEVSFDEQFWKTNWGEKPNKWSTADSDWYRYNAPDWWAGYLVSYKLKFKDGQKPQYLTEFKNTASIKVFRDGEEIIFSGDRTVEYGDPVVYKKMTPSGSTATVEILINPSGQTFPDTDILTVSDVMSDTLAFYLNTIEVYEETLPGSGVWVIKPLTFGGTGEYSYTTQGENTIIFSLPNTKSIKIEYKVAIKGNAGENVEISNTVSVEGFGTAAVGKVHEIEKTQGSGGGEREKLIIVKEDADDEAIKLPSAKFKLYAFTDTPDSFPGSIQLMVGGKTLGFRPIRDLTTEVDGMAAYGVEVNQNELTNGYIYALVETDAPTGYTKLTEPIFFYYNDLSKMSGFDEERQAAIMKEAQQVGDFLRIKNIRQSYGIKLPETGGGGTAGFIAAGILLTSFAAAIVCRRRKRRGHTD